MPSYNVTGTLCPTLPYASTLITVSDATPTTLENVVGGETLSFIGIHNRNAARVDALGQFGAGAYAVVQGTGELTDGGGLSLAVSACAVTLDGAVTASAGTLALTGSAYNWVYLLQNGTLTKTTSVTTTPPANPAAKCVFLGRVQCGASTITDIDYSGRLEWRGGMLYRRLGDAGAPSDTPVSRYQIVTRTGGGVYLWTGDQYVAMAGALGAVVATAVDNTSVSLAMLEQIERNWRRFALNLTHVLGTAEPWAGLEEQLELAVSEAA